MIEPLPLPARLPPSLAEDERLHGLLEAVSARGPMPELAARVTELLVHLDARFGAAEAPGSAASALQRTNPAAAPRVRALRIEHAAILSAARELRQAVTACIQQLDEIELARADLVEWLVEHFRTEDALLRGAAAPRARRDG